MFPIPQGEKLIETKVCRQCQASFPITDKDLEFYDKISPVFNGKKYQIPSPTLCPDCRQRRRLAFRNERKLYKRTCDATGKNIISIYSPDKPFKVYHQDYWWSDGWNPVDYGRNINISKSFFNQFGSLLSCVPQPSVVIQNAENSEYTSGGIGNKSCYMVFLASYNQDCLYDYWIFNSTNLIDCSVSHDSNHCYECSEIDKCSSCFFSKKLINCSDCYLCSGCIGCTNCIDCQNQTNKSYMIHNVQVTKKEFLEELQKLHKYTLIGGKNKNIVKYSEISNSEQVIGDNVSDSKNSFIVFGGKKGSEIKYVYDFYDISDSYDANNQAYDCYKTYECYAFEKVHDSMSIYLSAEVSDTYYSIYCFSSSHLFGCIGLKNKQYCIFNKQYTKEQYEELVPKIIEKMMADGEWGEFFSSNLSPFGYNESPVNEPYPLEKSEALAKGFNWSDYEAPFPKVEKIIPASKLPEDIAKIPDDILNWAIECEVTGKPFRIIKQELEFYRKHNLPIPRRHPDQRHKDRMELRNPRKLFERKCDKCSKDILTTYAPERPEIVYCEECYNKEII